MPGRGYCSLLERFNHELSISVSLVIIIIITLSVSRSWYSFPGSGVLLGVGLILSLLFVGSVLLIFCVEIMNCIVSKVGVTDENNNSMHQEIHNNQAL